MRARICSTSSRSLLPKIRIMSPCVDAGSRSRKRRRVELHFSARNIGFYTCFGGYNYQFPSYQKHEKEVATPSKANKVQPHRPKLELKKVPCPAKPTLLAHATHLVTYYYLLPPFTDSYRLHPPSCTKKERCIHPISKKHSVKPIPHTQEITTCNKKHFTLRPSYLSLPFRINHTKRSAGRKKKA